MSASFFIKPCGEIIELSSTHFNYIVENLDLYKEFYEKDLLKKIISAKESKESPEIYFSESFNNSTEEVTKIFLNKSGFIRVFFDSIMFPKNGINSIQLFSLKKILNELKINEIIINFKDREIELQVNEILNADSFSDLPIWLIKKSIYNNRLFRFYEK